mmetsp:Transcript_37714/g.107954  ORF Transcript_37714/g.107954 Transcript_37714/m.107954 type:complete len:204 (-) Transcript_37714:1111-1722(-)
MAQLSLSSSSSALEYFGRRSSLVQVLALGRLPGGFAGATLISAAAKPPGGSRGQAVTNSRNRALRVGVILARTSANCCSSGAPSAAVGRRCCRSSSRVHSVWPPQNNIASSLASNAQTVENWHTSSTPARNAATWAATPSRSHQRAASSTNSSRQCTSSGRAPPPGQSSGPPRPVSQNTTPQDDTYWSKLHVMASPSLRPKNS